MNKSLSITTDLADFEWEQLSDLVSIITAIGESGYPDEFELTDVRVAFNKISQYVFLMNAHDQIIWVDGSTGLLDLFYCCPTCGYEQFDDLFRIMGERCCADYLEQCFLNRQGAGTTRKMGGEQL